MYFANGYKVDARILSDKTTYMFNTQNQVRFVLDSRNRKRTTNTFGMDSNKLYHVLFVYQVELRKTSNNS